jgi:hypothetical protein
MDRSSLIQGGNGARLASYLSSYASCLRTRGSHSSHLRVSAYLRRRSKTVCLLLRSSLRFSLKKYIHLRFGFVLVLNAPHSSDLSPQPFPSLRAYGATKQRRDLNFIFYRSPRLWTARLSVLALYRHASALFRRTLGVP